MNGVNPDRGTVQAELERRILHGLSCEWHSAIAMIDPAYRREMPPPLFSLGDMPTKWGSWSGEKREIRLSRRLVLNHPWDSVREVLLHEMAHQMTAEVFGACFEPAHGPLFRKACDLLGANPSASGSFPLLADRLELAVRATQDKTLARVRKLLALAESANRHEAEAAMLKAHELMARHTIEAIAAGTPRGFISAFSGSPALRHNRFDYQLAALLQDFYFVVPMWVSAYVVDRQKMGRVLELSGTPRNLRTALFVAGFMRRVVIEEWAGYGSAGRRSRRPPLDFAVGLLQGFRSKLEAGMAAQSPLSGNRYPLVRVVDPELAAYTGRRYPRTVGVYRSARNVDPRLLSAGRAIGSRLVLKEPSVQIGTGKGGLLTAGS